jgi:hypothetical protein
MGGDDSQKLLPWRGIYSLSRAQTSGSLRNQHCNGNGATFCTAACENVAQLQTAWVILGKHRWVSSRACRSWQEAGNRRAAYYPKLPPGHFRFHVIASNNDGVWNTTGAVAEIVVPPAFYQTEWFTALCVCAVSRQSEKFLIGQSRKFLLTAVRLRDGTNRDEPTGTG